MSIKKIQKVLLSVVFFHLIFNSNSINASALDSNISLGDNSSVSVTVPSEINVSFNADGTNTISEFAVTNASLVPIIIKNVNVKSLNSWNLKPEETPILKDSKELVLQFNNKILGPDDNALHQEIPCTKEKVSLPISISRGAWTYPISKESAFEFAIYYSIGQRAFTLSLDYGNRLETRQVENDANVELPIPERAGYKFTGWKAHDGVIYQGGSNFTMPIGDYSLEAQWIDDNPAILVDGVSFNKILKEIITTNTTNNIKSIVFTKKAIPQDKLAAAKLVSIKNPTDQSDAKANIYAYVDGETIYVAPFTEDYNTYFNGNSSYMFSGLDSISSIIFSDYIKTSQVTNMEGMFLDCKKLVSLDVSKFDTSQVINMYAMFKNCSKLEILDLSGWNTGRVTTMRDMFNTCSALTSANISNFDTSKVTDMGWMFHKDGMLTGEMTIMNPNTSGVGMFQTASYYPTSRFILNYIDDKTKENAAKLVATKSENSNVFLYEKEAWLVDGQVFNKKIKPMILSDAKSIEFTDRVIPSEKIKDGIKVTTDDSPVRAYIWREESNPTKYFVSPDVKGGKIIFNVDSQKMFENTSLESISFNNIDTSRVTNMEGMFRDCTSLVSLVNISKFDTRNVTDIGGMFQKCGLLTELDVSNFNTGNVKSMWGTFNGTKSLTSLNLSGWDTGKVTNMRYMFYEDFKLSGEITISNSDLKTDTTNAFSGTSTASDARFVVKYSDESKVLAQKLVDTKSPGANVILFENYTITYVLNEGSNPDDAPLTYNIESNKITLPTPTKDDFDFAGWFTTADFSDTAVQSIESGTTGNKTFYAKWTEIASNQEGESGDQSDNQSEDQSESDSNKPNTEKDETPNNSDIDNESNDTGGSIDNPSTEENETPNNPDIDNESNDTGGSIDNPSTNENNSSTNEDNTTSGSDKNNPSENLEGNPNLGDSTDNSADSSVDIKKAMLNPYKHIKLLIVNLGICQYSCRI